MDITKLKASTVKREQGAGRKPSFLRKMVLEATGIGSRVWKQESNERNFLLFLGAIVGVMVLEEKIREFLSIELSTREVL